MGSDPEEMSNHVEKIRDFMRRVIKKDIRKSQQLFDLIKGTLPTNATRNSFDQNINKCRYTGLCFKIYFYWLFLDIICIDQDRVFLNGAFNFIHANRVPIGDDGKNEVLYYFYLNLKYHLR